MDFNFAATLAAPAATVCIGGFMGLAGVWMGQRLSRRTAEKQWWMDQKLKTYSQVLRAINEYTLWLADVSESRKFGKSGNATSTLKTESAQIAEDFHAAYAVAPLFLIKNSLDLLEKAKPAFFYHSSPFEDPDVEDADKNWDLLKGVRDELVRSARRDLALSPGPPANDI